MSKKSVSTPTITESRARRTPKPNPKYAVDYVAKIRISPDRKDDDEESDNEQMSKSIVRNVKTPDPKKPSVKSQTPIMSRLSTLRNVPKRSSPPVVASKASVMSVKRVLSPKDLIVADGIIDDKESATSYGETKAVITRSGKSDSIQSVQKSSSPVAKTIKKGEKDEITIVNINDIMKQTDHKRPASSDANKSSTIAKKQKVESKDVEVFDIEDEISVSSAVVRPTTRQRANAVAEKTDAKPKVAIKSPGSAVNVQKQPSPIVTQKKKMMVISPQKMPSKSSPTIVTRTKISPGKTQENKEQLGQVLAKRILRKVVKPGSNENQIDKKQETERPEKLVKKSINPMKVKKFTTFEKWSVLNFPQIQPQPARSVLCLSLTKIGNKIKSIKLPSSEWSYRITLQKINKENSDKGETYTGDIEDCGIQEGEKGNYAPVNITFERSDGTDSKPVSRSIVFQNKSFSILIDGKQCKLIGAPQYIYDLIEIQTLLHIVDKVDAFHSYVDQGDK